MDDSVYFRALFRSRVLFLWPCLATLLGNDPPSRARVQIVAANRECAPRNRDFHPLSITRAKDYLQGSVLPDDNMEYF